MKKIIFLAAISGLISLCSAAPIELTVRVQVPIVFIPPDFIEKTALPLTIDITAYNPNSESVKMTAYGSWDFLFYVIDDIYDPHEYVEHPPGLALGGIAPYSYETKQYQFGTVDNERYPLTEGWHTIVAKTWANDELVVSGPYSFYIRDIPEPASILLLGLGAVILRKR